MFTVSQFTSAAIGCVGLLTASIAHADDPSQQHGSDTQALRFDSRVAVGSRISPVELNLRGKNPLLVGLGSYLVNAAGACNDCHTNPPFVDGGDPFQGETEIINAEQFLAGGRQFGPITAPNITPDEDGNPAGLTFEEFEHLLRTGRDDEDPTRILQVMPWNIYANMTRLDLRAIYEYLRAVPPLPDNTSQPAEAP